MPRFREHINPPKTTLENPSLLSKRQKIFMADKIPLASTTSVGYKSQERSSQGRIRSNGQRRKTYGSALPHRKLRPYNGAKTPKAHDSTLVAQPRTHPARYTNHMWYVEDSEESSEDCTPTVSINLTFRSNTPKLKATRENRNTVFKRDRVGLADA